MIAGASNDGASNLGTSNDGASNFGTSNLGAENPLRSGFENDGRSVRVELRRVKLRQVGLRERGHLGASNFGASNFGASNFGMSGLAKSGLANEGASGLMSGTLERISAGDGGVGMSSKKEFSFTLLRIASYFDDTFASVCVVGNEASSAANAGATPSAADTSNDGISGADGISNDGSSGALNPERSGALRPEKSGALIPEKSGALNPERSGFSKAGSSGALSLRSRAR